MKKFTGIVSRELGIKRLYIKGSIKAKCPFCKCTLIRNLERDCFNYPTVGKGIIGIDCPDCEKEFGMPYILKPIKIEFDYDATKIKELR